MPYWAGAHKIYGHHILGPVQSAIKWINGRMYKDVLVSGTLTVDGNIKFSSGGLARGEIYAYDVDEEITISGVGISNKVKVEVFTANGITRGGITSDYTNNHILIGSTAVGTYLVTASITSESGAGAAATYGFGLFKNNGTIQFENVHAHRSLSGGGGDTGSISLNGGIICEGGDTIELWVWNETNTTNVIIDDVTITIVQDGGI